MRSAFLPALLCITRTAFADVFHCGTVWRSVPCEQAAGHPFSRPTVSAEQEKLEITVKLEDYAEFVAAEMHHHDFEADGVRDFCLREDVSVEECRARALKADRSLTAFYQSSLKLIHRKRELAQHEDEIALRRQRLAQPGSKKSRRRSRDR